MNIFVKYCGGCNPRYDRNAFVQRLKEMYPEHIFSEKYDDPDLSMIVCGCPSACAEKADAAAPYGMITVWSEEEADSVVRFFGLKPSE